jgi:chromosome segregation ATPase
LERDVADARAQVAATIEAEKKSIERAKAADKKLEEAKIVFSASRHEADTLQSKIKSLTSELSAAQAQLRQTSAALAEETRLRRACVEEFEAIKSQASADATALKEQLQSTDCSRSVFEARAEELSATARALQEEVKQVHAAAAAQLIQLEATLAETKAAHASETTDLKLRLASAEKMCSIHQQQHQQETSRQERERLFVEQKLAKLEEQQSAAAAAESAAAAARAEAERSAAAATERIAAVSAVFKKMANLDEGMEGDCTCLQCMQTLADPVLLQVIFVPL